MDSASRLLQSLLPLRIEAAEVDNDTLPCSAWRSQTWKPRTLSGPYRTRSRDPESNGRLGCPMGITWIRSGTAEERAEQTATIFAKNLDTPKG